MNAILSNLVIWLWVAAFVKFAIDMEQPAPQPKPGELMPLDRWQVERWKR